MGTFEFDVTVTVRKRIHVSGPKTPEAARAVLKSAIQGGMGFGPFAKIGDDGRPMETVVSNDFDIVDASDGGLASSAATDLARG